MSINKTAIEAFLSDTASKCIRSPWCKRCLNQQFRQVCATQMPVELGPLYLMENEKDFSGTGIAKLTLRSL